MPAHTALSSNIQVYLYPLISKLLASTPHTPLSITMKFIALVTALVAATQPFKQPLGLLSPSTGRMCRHVTRFFCFH